MNTSRWLSLLVLCTGFLLIVVDMTIVNVALPSIQKDLGFTQSGLAWVVNAYLIAFGGLLLLAGRVGDLVGRKRVYLAGLVIFTTASVLCGLSFAQPMLIAARFVQGIGGAVSSAVILAMIVTLFPEPLERAKAFGVFSFVASAGAAVGLIAGGLITQVVSWHWIFFVNLPIGIATAIVSARLLADDKGIGLGRGADVTRRDHGHRGADAGRLHHRPDLGPRPRLGADRRPRRGRGGAARGFRRPPGARPKPDPAPAVAPLAQGCRQQPGAGADVDRVPRLLLPRLARPRARAGLRSDGDRPRLPARGGRDGFVLGPPLGPAHRALRSWGHAGRRPGCRDDRVGGGRGRPGPPQLLRPPDAADGAARPRRRALVPGADHDRDGRRRAKGRRPCLRPAQHD